MFDVSANNDSDSFEFSEVSGQQEITDEVESDSAAEELESDSAAEESVSDNEETQSEVVVDNSTTYSYDFTNLESIGFLLLVSILGFCCMLAFVLGLNTK